MFKDNPTLLISLIVLLVAILIITILIVIFNKRKQKEVLDENTLNEIYVAFGEKNNIKNIDRIQNRITILVKDLSLINNNTLRKLNIAGSIKQNEVTIIFKNGSKELVSYIKNKMKE